MNYKRICKRIKEEIRATYRISKVTTLKKGLITFQSKLDIQKMVRTGCGENENIKKRLLKKHEILLEYYNKLYGDYYRDYNFSKAKDDMKNNPDKSDVIWICWWQGLNNAPEVVKKCVESIKRNAGNHSVIIITLDNYKEYIDIPQEIESKVEKGIITLTNLSDLLRLSLLSKYGGLWLDATFYCKDNTKLDKYFKYPLWSIKRPDYGHVSVACGNFAGYSLYCSAEYRWIYTVIKDYFIHYWKMNNFMVDYLMIDYMIVLAQKYNKEIDEAFEKIPKNNPNCDELCKKLNDMYTPEKWKKISDNTDLFKLTWKKDFVKVVNQNVSFYGKMK